MEVIVAIYSTHIGDTTRVFHDTCEGRAKCEDWKVELARENHSWLSDDVKNSLALDWSDAEQAAFEYFEWATFMGEFFTTETLELE